MQFCEKRKTTLFWNQEIRDNDIEGRTSHTVESFVAASGLCHLKSSVSKGATIVRQNRRFIVDKKNAV